MPVLSPKGGGDRKTTVIFMVDFAREECFTMLGLMPGATPQEIKRAYWRLAKVWHPDVNPAADAQETFIRIHQAYEILVNGKVRAAAVYAPAYGEEADDFFDRMYGQERNEARTRRQERAAQYARMQYEEFKKNNELFKSSFWYVPAKLFTYFAWLIGNLCGVSCLFFPAWIAFVIGQTSVAIAMFPFSLLGLAVIAAAFRFKQEVVERYL